MRESRTCSGPQCQREAMAKGLCRAHYNQAYVGKPLTPLLKKTRAFRDENGRVCTACNEYKAWSAYYLRSNGFMQSTCKECFIKKQTIINRRNAA